MRRGFMGLIATGLILASISEMRAGAWQGGIGVIGDSYSDEYAFYPPHRSLARNWVEMLADLRGLDFGSYDPSGWGEPRNQGFAYNWARSAATTDDMIAQGQHTGLAEQVARGEVRLVCMFIGGNDFIEALKEPDAPTILPDVTTRALGNVELALRTILEAHREVRVILATVPEVGELPEFVEDQKTGRIPEAWFQAVSRAIQEFNTQIRSIAAHDERVALADLYFSSAVTRLVSPRYVLVGGRWVDRMAVGNGIETAFLPDRRHVGTVVQGLMARLMIATANRDFGLNIPLLSDREILEYAERTTRQPSATLVGAQGHAPEALAGTVASP